jgi:hypothetical protein
MWNMALPAELFLKTRWMFCEGLAQVAWGRGCGAESRETGSGACRRGMRSRFCSTLAMRARCGSWTRRSRRIGLPVPPLSVVTRAPVTESGPGWSPEGSVATTCYSCRH